MTRDTLLAGAVALLAVGFAASTLLGRPRTAPRKRPVVDVTLDELLEPVVVDEEVQAEVRPAVDRTATPKQVSQLFWDRPHECSPRCPDRPGVYTGPVILGRRCQVCNANPVEPGEYECGRCWDAADRAAVRRADR